MPLFLIIGFGIDLLIGISGRLVEAEIKSAFEKEVSYTESSGLMPPPSPNPQPSSWLYRQVQNQDVDVKSRISENKIVILFSTLSPASISAISFLPSNSRSLCGIKRLYAQMIFPESFMLSLSLKPDNSHKRPSPVRNVCKRGLVWHL